MACRARRNRGKRDGAEAAISTARAERVGSLELSKLRWWIFCCLFLQKGYRPSSLSQLRWLAGSHQMLPHRAYSWYVVSYEPGPAQLPFTFTFTK